MTVLRPKCRKAMRVPPDKEAIPNLKARCGGCGTVFGYPLSDKVAFVLLAVFVGVFSVAASLAAFGAGLAILLSQGLLYAYAFTAINRVLAGDLKSFMPNVGVETVLVAGLGLIPLAGRFLAAFVQSYTYLAIGCLLGLAVFKKAPELGLD